MNIKALWNFTIFHFLLFSRDIFETEVVGPLYHYKINCYRCNKHIFTYIKAPRGMRVVISIFVYRIDFIENGSKFRTVFFAENVVLTSCAHHKKSGPCSILGSIFTAIWNLQNLTYTHFLTNKGKSLKNGRLQMRRGCIIILNHHDGLLAWWFPGCYHEAPSCASWLLPFLNLCLPFHVQSWLVWWVWCVSLKV